MNVILKELLLSMIMDLPWEFELGTKPYVLPSQCEQVFYSEVPGKSGWSYVVRYDPRGREVKYIHVAEDEDNNEEEDHDYED
jgi:hypothetical protein